MSAPVGLQPIRLRDAVFTVDSDDFSAAVLGVTFAPEVEWEWIDDYGGGASPYMKTVHWTCTVGYAQDMRAGSLARYLLEQAAAVRTIVFTPQPGLSGPPITCDALIIPGPVGGAADDGILTAAVTLPLFDEPVVGP